MATVVEQTHMADGEHLVHTTDAEARRVITAALRDRMRITATAAGEARRMGVEDAAVAYLAAHNLASDVLAGFEAQS